MDDKKMQNEKILISAPIKNRAWILPYYLKALQDLNYRPSNIGFFFLLNDCTDESPSILQEFKRKNEGNYRYIEIQEINTGRESEAAEAGKPRSGRNAEFYKALAGLRNRVLDFAAQDKEAEYLFSVDSDIIVKSDVIDRLLSARVDIVAALIDNGVTDYNFFHFPKGPNRHYLPTCDLFEVYLTGAVCLISRAVFTNKKIRYSEKYGTGEDLGFCESARQEGFKSYVLNYFQEHVMLRSNK